MKYAIVIPDGCADEPQDSLGGKTPLQAANVPNMDAIAKAGVVGRADNVPAHLPAGSDVANLSLLGYSPLEYFTGRAPLEAAAQGIQLWPNDWAIRCNLVTIQDQIMKSFTAGQISSEEAKGLLETAQAELGGDGIEFHPGVSYRNLLVVRGQEGSAPFSMETRTTPPHDLSDKSVADSYPRGLGSDWLSDMMSRSVELFANHPVNMKRVSEGRPPATNVWLWGLGKQPALTPFAELYGKTGKMITAVDLLRGLAALIGWDRIEVPGATGYLDTDYAAKGQYAIDALDSTDVICVHVEATDEASHEGDIPEKIKALEAIDAKIVGPLHEALKKHGDYRMIVLPDHPTFCRTKTHSHGFVPLALCGSDITPDAFETFDEPNADASSLSFDEGWKMMPYFLGV
ncbi:cofactor-independent phosphoglycerate mutase [Blastopirellula marina]|uniref:Cofactor-independent phosphoglycerate mutase n=1 Tax=Blastopirellula marina TaxID=124 RepID=A0A2S8GF03_9BACT|nr:cofactor-independent phosphoglycerate mutase [Blastopirellula marina]PQO42664.1 cofactor-independent phosphoglycerate mutase [Blastopirellula marina]PTL46430.1 cofactor-independent phosphoglycerate mutase [Blastopirellula marina]